MKEAKLPVSRVLAELCFALFIGMFILVFLLYFHLLGPCSEVTTTAMNLSCFSSPISVDDVHELRQDKHQSLTPLASVLSDPWT